MKTFLLCTLIAITPISTTPKTPIWYGRVFDTYVYFYSTPQDDERFQMFIIEPSYFVQLTQEFNSTFYSAKYRNITGYVKKKDVQATSSSIKNPYLDNIYFRVYLRESQTLYTKPSSQSDVIKEIPLYTKNVEYIGKIQGETMIKERTSDWYYCKYTLDKTYYGYIYAEGVDQMSTIYKNNEECDYVEIPDFSTPTNNLSIVTTDSNGYNKLVVFVSIFVLIFVFLAIKSSSILHSKKQKNKEVTNFLDTNY